MNAKRIKSTVASAIAGVAACLAVEADTPRERTGEQAMMEELGFAGGDIKTRTSSYAALLSAFRDSAAKNPENAAEYWFSMSARLKWNNSVVANTTAMQLTDFFTGGIMLCGGSGSGRVGAVAGIYNPWWDAMLLVKMNVVESGTWTGPSAQIKEFHFLSGETFRGEVPTDTPASIRTVVPEGDPLAVELWRVASGTRKRFEKLFPLDGKPSWGRAAALIASLDDTKEMERIQTRAGVRLKLMLEFVKNTRDVGIAAQIVELIRHGSHYRLCDHFREPASRPLLKTLSEMPEMFRKDFIPYGRVATAEATLYLFVNPKVPRLFATVTLPRDRKKTPPSLEWYDLLQSDELLAAWNNRKGVAK